MNWIDEAVQSLIKENNNKDEYVCAAGISPSGPIHIGNFREFLTSYFVHTGLKLAGKKSKFIMSFDDFDRLRKIPASVKAVVGDSFDKYIGMPDSDVPDPFGCHKSYAEHFEKQFEDAVKQFGIEVQYIYQSKEYRSGRYDEDIIKALKNRKKIYDILYEYKYQEATDEGREQYVPIAVYCEKCGKDSTKVLSVSDDCETITYKCACGHNHTVKIREYHNIKLVWKADWPMRWAAEKVDFEPGGKDHGTEGSSYTVGKEIVKIFNYKAPAFVMYEFIGIKGGAGKMASSSGTSYTPEELLKVCPPEMIMWLYSKVPARQSWNFALDEEILRQYHEFDRSVTAYNTPTCPENIKDAIKYALINKADKTPCTVSAQLLFSLGSIVNFDQKMVEELYSRIEPNINKKDLTERLAKIKYWATTYNPENISKLLENKNEEYFESLPEKEKADVRTLFNCLNNNEYELQDLQTLLYDIPKDKTKTDKENQPLQKKFFENIYMLTTGKTTGPRLYLFLGALKKEMYLKLLNF